MVAEALLTRPLTYDDLAAMPDDGKRYEVINGELYELPTPPIQHQRVLGHLMMTLGDHVENLQLGWIYPGPLDLLLSAHNVVQPDILYISRKRRHIIKEAFISGVPDILVEILSHQNRTRDLVTKSATYATFGVPEYWLVDLENESSLLKKGGAR